MEVKCYFCGHTMTLINMEIKIANNNRTYIDSHYQCNFKGCNRMSKVTISDYIYTDSFSKYKIDKI